MKAQLSHDLRGSKQPTEQRRVVAYVDGLNLYGGLKAGFGRRLLWHDPQALVESTPLPGQKLERIKYFNARFLGPSEAVVDQATHFEALCAHCSKLDLIEGRFQPKEGSCPNCRARWTAFEEKETDINIALALAEDAVAGLFDMALIVSADSDLCPAVRAGFPRAGTAASQGRGGVSTKSSIGRAAASGGCLLHDPDSAGARDHAARPRDQRLEHRQAPTNLALISAADKVETAPLPARGRQTQSPRSRVE